MVFPGWFAISYSHFLQFCGPLCARGCGSGSTALQASVVINSTDIDYSLDISVAVDGDVDNAILLRIGNPVTLSDGRHEYFAFYESRTAVIRWLWFLQQRY